MHAVWYNHWATLPLDFRTGGCVVPSLSWVENQIARVEGFEVRFLHPTGRDVRGDMHDVAAYPFERKLSGDRTVAEWITLRFRERYRGFNVEAMHRDHTPAHGNTLLETLRSEYD